MHAPCGGGVRRVVARDHRRRHGRDAGERRRAARLIELGQHKRLAFHSRFVGARVWVLTEDLESAADSGLASGLTDNYMRVRFPPPPGLRPNDLVEVRVTQVREDIVFGEVSEGWQR